MSIQSQVVGLIGGGGFIGGATLAALTDLGHTVRVVDRSAPPPTFAGTWVRCDLSARDQVSEALRGVDTIVNVAGASGIGRARESYVRDNVDAADHLCAAAELAGVGRIVYVSTSAVYGRSDGPDESAPCHPTCDYGVSKLRAEHRYEAWKSNREDRHLIVVRPSVVFGPGDRGSAASLLERFANPTYRLPGSGSAVKSLAFVDNLAAFIAHVMEHEGLLRFNYCDRPDLTVAQLAAIVRDSLDLPPARSEPIGMSFLRVGLARLTGAPEHALRRAAVRSARSDRFFNADRAHDSGFVPPTEIGEALAKTAASDHGWVRLVVRGAS